MPATAGVRLAVRAGIATITLPRARIGESEARSLCEAASQIELDPDIRVIVLAGAANSFCTGIDQPGDWQRHYDFVRSLAALSSPVIAMIRGDATAEGCELALASDLRILSSRAGFALPQVSDGRPLHPNTVSRLGSFVGRAQTLDLLLTGRRVSASEALRIGLAQRIAAPGRIRAVASQEAKRLAAKGPLALRYAKEAVLRGFGMTFEQGMRLEQDLYVLLQTTADRAEGIKSFLGRRPPRFRGR